MGFEFLGKVLLTGPDHDEPGNDGSGAWAEQTNEPNLVLVTFPTWSWDLPLKDMGFWLVDVSDPTQPTVVDTFFQYTWEESIPNGSFSYSGDRHTLGYWGDSAVVLGEALSDGGSWWPHGIIVHPIRATNDEIDFCEPLEISGENFMLWDNNFRLAEVSSTKCVLKLGADARPFLETFANGEPRDPFHSYLVTVERDDVLSKPYVTNTVEIQYPKFWWTHQFCDIMEGVGLAHVSGDLFVTSVRYSQSSESVPGVDEEDAYKYNDRVILLISSITGDVVDFLWVREVFGKTYTTSTDWGELDDDGFAPFSYYNWDTSSATSGEFIVKIAENKLLYALPVRVFNEPDDQWYDHHYALTITVEGESMSVDFAPTGLDEPGAVAEHAQWNLPELYFGWQISWNFTRHPGGYAAFMSSRATAFGPSGRVLVTPQEEQEEINSFFYGPNLTHYSHSDIISGTFRSHEYSGPSELGVWQAVGEEVIELARWDIVNQEFNIKKTFEQWNDWERITLGEEGVYIYMEAEVNIDDGFDLQVPPPAGWQDGLTITDVVTIASPDTLETYESIYGWFWSASNIQQRGSDESGHSLYMRARRPLATPEEDAD